MFSLAVSRKVGEPLEIDARVRVLLLDSARRSSNITRCFLRRK